MWLVLGLVVLAGACDPAYRIGREAPAEGVTPDQVKSALASDSTVETRLAAERKAVRKWLGESREWILGLRCERDGIIANVWVTRDPRIVVVDFHELGHPGPNEDADWKESLDHLCSLLSRNCPEIGAWELDRTGDMPPLLAVLMLLFCSLALVGVFLLRRYLRWLPPWVWRRRLPAECDDPPPRA